MATFSLFNRFHRKIKSFFGGYIEHNHIDYQRLLVYVYFVITTYPLIPQHILLEINLKY